MKLVILIFSIFTILPGCSSDEENNKTGTDQTRDQQQAAYRHCVGTVINLDGLERAVIKGYRIRTCNLPENVVIENNNIN